MTTHMTGTREEWLAARLELLKAEQELTRRNDDLARQRQQLPWVRIDKEYVFCVFDTGSSAVKALQRQFAAYVEQTPVKSKAAHP